jgi:RNA polymerase sigma-B factor
VSGLGALEDAELFRRLPDEAAREELLVRHRPLAMYLARRFAGRGESLEDLEQVAMLGLLQAIDRLDPEREVKFSTFATITITGELKRHLRDKGWAVRVPRPLQERSIRIGRAIGELTQELGRSPTVDEIAARIDLSDEEVLEGLEAARAYSADPLEAPAGAEEGPAPIDTLASHDERFDDFESWQSVAPAIQRLPERERTILYLRFIEERTQSEIAEELGISQMHVSRLLAKTLTALRENVEE